MTNRVDLVKQIAPRLGLPVMRTMARLTHTRRRVIGLCYHSVHPTQGFSMRVSVFEEQLRWLRATCDVVPFREALDALSKPNTRQPAVFLTFDDGYADNHEFVLPLLQKHQLPATVFLTAGLIDGDPGVLARFRAIRGEGVEGLEWSQVRELLATGIEIGAHTYSHPNLTRLGTAEAASELRRSKELIEDRLGVRVDLLAYPFGKPRRHFDHTTITLAREAGYTYAAAVLYRSVRPTDSPLAIPRFFTAGASVEELAAKIRGDWDHLGYLQEHLPRSVARTLSPEDFRW